MTKKILILCPYPFGQAPSQRFRFEQYLDFLEQEGFAINQQGFLDEQTWQVLYQPGNQLRKVKGIVKGFIKRFLLIFTVLRYDVVFIHREATPLGPPIIEWGIAKIFRKKIIYDFDDAIWLPNTSQENKIAAALKCHSKVKRICEWSYKVSCGNEYLANYARQFNENVQVIPTTIDTEYHRNKMKDESRRTDGLEIQDARFKNQDSSISLVTTPIIGWTGTHSTEKYLDQLIPVLQELEKTHAFIFRVISNHNPQLPLKSFQYQAWNKDTEIEDLSKFDIGVMPLEDDEWAQGKCGFKGLQYMALGITTVMSPVGVNQEIIEDGSNGFLATSKKDWKIFLTQLLEQSDLRHTLGTEGVKTIKKKYSVQTNQLTYFLLFSE